MKARYLFPQDYMADPSAHVFGDRLYIYPSHDWDSGECFDDDGGHFQMKDYHVLSLDDVMDGEVTDHGKIFGVEDVAWCEKQLWDSDIVELNGKYYLVFSGKDYNGCMRLGVAIADRPEGPFKPQADPIRGSYSIDPCVFKDDDGAIYTYFGGIWGGRNASFHHNLLAHHWSRNPRFDHPYVYDHNNAATIEQYHGNVDFRNNAIYNWGQSENCYGGELCRLNLVNNYYKEGPASKSNKYFFVAYANSCESCAGYGYTYEELMPRIYADGNLYLKRDGSQASFSTDNYAGIYDKDKQSYTTYSDDATGTFRQPALLPITGDGRTCHTTTHTADGAFEAILSYGGASLSRDAVDRRAVDDARSGSATITDGGNGSTGGIIDTQTAVGGWPDLTATDEEIARAATDSDGDGIPDYYEDLFGLDKLDAADGKAKTLDPQGLYTNLEVYLHYLVRDITENQVKGGSYTALN